MWKWAILVWVLSSVTLMANNLAEANNLLDQKAYNQARTLLNRLVRQRSLEAEATTMLCRLETEQKNLDRALPLAQNAIRLAPESAEAHYRHAMVLDLQMERASEFMKHNLLFNQRTLLEKAYQLDPNHPETTATLIYLYTNQSAEKGGNLERATEIVNNLIKTGSERGNFYLGEVLLAKRKYEEAIQAYQSALKVNEEDPNIAFGLGVAFGNLNKLDEAEQAFNGISIEENPSLYYRSQYQTAKFLILNDQTLEKALGIMNDYIIKAPNEPKYLKYAAWWRKGQAHEKLNQYREALRAYERSMTLDNNFLGAKQSIHKLRRKMADQLQ